MKDRTPRDIAVDDQLRAAGAEGAQWLTAAGWGPPVTVPLHRAARWQRETRARMLAAEADESWTWCDHLLDGGPQPVVVHAEHPTDLLCRACSVAARPYRRCLDCGGPAASESPADGREDVFMGPVAIYTRVRCATCHRADPRHGTFGNGTFGNGG
ncbi:hypothetical protein ATKI12_0187 [Kitasatospora sp. Ki12]|uniref:hypothetical protein n=1 Tax=Kitasatospora xanthocidica TaxID=83382 RepID=UPI0016776102|nr:hypothetical protein [Kitasatospora xanthocidica]GHF50342.1 hypothetical protein GCM10018790_30150 [Kitasatospora xanthocidica]